MDLQKVYQEKLTTAQEAVKVVKSGDWLDWGWCTGTPDALDKALAARMPELHDIKIRGGILLKVPEIFKVENAPEHFCWNSWHMSGIERKAIAQGIAYYGPIRYSELPRYYMDLDCPSDVVMIQVAPMDPIWRRYANGRKPSSWKSMKKCPTAGAGTPAPFTLPK